MLRPYVRSLVILFLVLIPAARLRAQTSELPRIGVWDLTSENVPSAELRLLSDRLRVELFNTGQFTVLEREQMNTMLKEQGFQQSGCVATECVVEVGQLLGVQKMVAGSVGRVGDVYTITLRIVDMETGALERTAVKDCRCSLSDILTTTIAQVAAELAGTAAVQTVPLRRGEGAGMLYIASTPSGAQIILNGRRRRERTPATLERLPAGEHIVRLVEGNLVAEKRVTVVRDDLVRLSLRLHPGTGSLFITSNPPEARVTIDGRAQATSSPLLIKEIASGPHTIRVEKADYLPWEERIVAAFNERTNVPVTLRPCGYLSIQVSPADAAVRIDGKDAGRADRLARFPLSVGDHRVVVRRADYDSLARTVTIVQGKLSGMRASLRSLVGGLRINSTPSGARITSDPPGISGTTPYRNDRVEPGRYRVTLRMANRTPYEETVEVKRDQTARISARLPWSPQYVYARNARIRRGFRWASLAAAVVSAGLAYKYEMDAKSANDDRNAAYERYRNAKLTADALYYRDQYDRATARYAAAAKKRNILYGAAGGTFGLGIVLWIR